MAKENVSVSDTSVYSLRFPDTHKVFYIGIANDPYKRFYQHLYGDGVNTEKDACIALLRERGQTPLMQTECVCHSRKAAELAEACLIEYYSAKGHHLTNILLNYLSEARQGRKCAEYEQLAIQTCKSRWHYILSWMSTLFTLDGFERQLRQWQLEEMRFIAERLGA